MTYECANKLKENKQTKNKMKTQHKHNVLLVSSYLIRQESMINKFSVVSHACIVSRIS